MPRVNTMADKKENKDSNAHNKNKRSAAPYARILASEHKTNESEPEHKSDEVKEKESAPSRSPYKRVMCSWTAPEAEPAKPELKSSETTTEYFEYGDILAAKPKSWQFGTDGSPKKQVVKTKANARRSARIRDRANKKKIALWK